MSALLSDAEAAEIVTQLSAGRLMVRALCLPRGAVGTREWIMSIPARADDPDLVIGAALDAGARLLVDRAALRDGHQALAAALERAVARVAELERLQLAAEARV